LEARRLRAADLLAAAKTPAQVAALIGAGHSSAKKWKAALANGSKETLTAKTPPESNSKLSDSQKSELVEILMRGPLASGFRTDLWTCRRVAEVVQKRFGVSYHPGRILHNLSFTPQKPEQLARERDEEAIQRCPQQDWPHIKRARRRRAPVIFLDETAFRLQVSKTPHLGAAGPNSCTALLGSRRPSLGPGRDQVVATAQAAGPAFQRLA
jgi:transposase